MNTQLRPVKSDAEAIQSVREYILQEGGIFREEPHYTYIELPSAYKINLRTPSSDYHVFEEIWINKEYEFLIRDYLSKYSSPPKTILDIGANIGCASLYFAHHFPEAAIYSVEAEKTNFDQLSMHLHLNPATQIKAYHRAFWINSEEELVVSTAFRDGREWAFSVSEKCQESSKQSTVQTISLPKLMEEEKLMQVDILKIDIEGAEQKILNDRFTLQWIGDKVKYLAMEIHEEAIPMSEALERVHSIGFETYVDDNVLFAFKK